ncbi:Polyphosphoinositide phosphatase [Sphaceloma murrayae]|uniref:Polyphosphoinositide phosphatase n=1 Tax=Sphaceloma murrayae TaxID=2082308 RepID=A0A2K1QWB3_9PEZI|nr:Polyphosphoinositide phosphatase [Sphaceloma murrayae]
MSPPRNRASRRAAAKASGEKFQPLTSASAIPMAHPDYSAPKTRTLFDIAAERNELFAKGQPFSPVHGDGLARDENGRVLLPAKDSSATTTTTTTTTNGVTTTEKGPRSEGLEDTGTEAPDDDPIGPLGESIFYAISLSMLHFTLSLLVHNQYASRPPTLWPLAGETMKAAPFLWVFIYGLKCEVVARWARVKQGIHFVLGVGAGCYLLWIGNRAGYLAVMKRAPPVGTVWVWSVIEMKLEWAVVSLVACIGYLWWNGFSVM